MLPNTQLLRALPKVDELLLSETLLERCEGAPYNTVIEAVREIIQSIRAAVLAGELAALPSREEIESSIAALIARKTTPSLRRVINGTGIVLHTNLGRAKMSEQVAQAVANVAKGYSTLEYDLDKAKRGSRYTHVESLITKLTGAEAAMAVNNNAAAVMLILGTLCRDKEVVISRGELVEIGGSFRVPEIMEQSNSKLIEVGTTNKTHLADYQRAIKPELTSALLKVHTSNFKIVGFTKEVSIAELSELAKEHRIPLIHDIGSGSLISLEKYGILEEPTVMDSLAAGADVVSFSGDKLLGGPQAGIIVGKKQYIDAMKKNPLTRALRIDKLSLAALEATLRAYLDVDRLEQNIPTLGMLAIDQQALRAKACQLAEEISAMASGLDIEVVEEQGQVGGGSVPSQMIPSWAVAISSERLSPNQLEEQLRLSPIPLIGRISKDRYMLDVRTIECSDFAYIAKTLSSITDQELATI